MIHYNTPKNFLPRVRCPGNHVSMDASNLSGDVLQVVSYASWLEQEDGLAAEVLDCLCPPLCPCWRTDLKKLWIAMITSKWHNQNGHSPRIPWEEWWKLWISDQTKSRLSWLKKTINLSSLPTDTYTYTPITEKWRLALYVCCVHFQECVLYVCSVLCTSLTLEDQECVLYVCCVHLSH